MEQTVCYYTKQAVMNADLQMLIASTQMDIPIVLVAITILVVLVASQLPRDPDGC